MKWKRMIRSFVLLLAVMQFAIPSKIIETASESYDAQSNDFFCYQDTNGELILFRYMGNEKEIVVPSSINGQPLKRIYEHAFSGSSCTGIIIEEGITTLDSSSIDNCYMLTDIALPDSIITMEDNPFLYCPKLKNIYISSEHPTLEVVDSLLYYTPENRLITSLAGNAPIDVSVREGTLRLDDGAFANCTRLEKAVLPQSLLEIGRYAFSSCVSLKEITLPVNLNSIDDLAFVDCCKLETIDIESKNVTLGRRLFFHCTSLRRIDVPDDHLTLETTLNGLYDKYIKELIVALCAREQTIYEVDAGTLAIGSGAFSNCVGLESIILPESLQEIGYYAFENCRSLKSIVIPASVSLLCGNAFRGCFSLTRVCFEDGNINISGNPFVDCPLLCSISLSEQHPTLSFDNGGLYLKHEKKLIAVLGGLYLSTFDILQGTLSIGESAFEGCKTLKSVSIPDGVQTIESLAFYNCDRLCSLTLPLSVIDISRNAFNTESLILKVSNGSYAHDISELYHWNYEAV